MPAALGFFDERNGVLATQGGTLLRTGDGGGSWHPDGRLHVDAIDVLSASVAYATTGRELLRTDDAGGSWHVVAPVTGALSFADALHGWVGTSATDDGGATWQPLNLPCPEPAGIGSIALSRVTATLGFAACGTVPGAGQQLKQLYVTEDGGATWELRAACKQLPSGGYLDTISFADDRNGLMTTGRGGLLATGDGGRTWKTLLFTDDATSIAAAQRLGAQELVVALLDGALLRSTDAGATWQLVSPRPPRRRLSRASRASATESVRETATGRTLTRRSSRRTTAAAAGTSAGTSPPATSTPTSSCASRGASCTASRSSGTGSAAACSARRTTAARGGTSRRRAARPT
jgi:photosystem II stability/assembly factor-like uncharacterized protein